MYVLSVFRCLLNLSQYAVHVNALVKNTEIMEGLTDAQVFAVATVAGYCICTCSLVLLSCVMNFVHLLFIDQLPNSRSMVLPSGGANFFSLGVRPFFHESTTQKVVFFTLTPILEPILDTLYNPNF